jgi:hypothetical protein
MIQESNGSLGYAPFGVGSRFPSTPFGLPLLVPIYPLRSMKRAIVEGPRRKIAGLRQAPQSVVVMDVTGLFFHGKSGFCGFYAPCRCPRS